MVLVAAFLLVLAACSPVLVREPLPANAGADELARFDGAWLSGRDVTHVRFEQGQPLAIGGVEWRDGRFQVDPGEVVVTDGEEHGFLSVRVREGDGWMEGWYLVEYRFTDDGDLLVWLPQAAAFADAVEAGDLAGVVERSDTSTTVTLTGPPEATLAFLQGAAGATLFDYRDPMVMRRLADR